MSWKPSERFIQVSIGMGLVAVSGYFLWKNTLRPIAERLSGKRPVAADYGETSLPKEVEKRPQKGNDSVARDEEERALLERHRREKERLQRELREQRQREEPQPKTVPVSPAPQP